MPSAGSYSSTTLLVCAAKRGSAKDMGMLKAGLTSLEPTRINSTCAGPVYSPPSREMQNRIGATEGRPGVRGMLIRLPIWRGVGTLWFVSTVAQKSAAARYGHRPAAEVTSCFIIQRRNVSQLYGSSGS